MLAPGIEKCLTRLFTVCRWLRVISLRVWVCAHSDIMHGTGLHTLILEPTSSATPTKSRRSRRPGRSSAVSNRSGLRNHPSACYLCSLCIADTRQLSSHARVQECSAEPCTHLLVAPTMKTSWPVCRPSI